MIQIRRDPGEVELDWNREQKSNTQPDQVLHRVNQSNLYFYWGAVRNCNRLHFVMIPFLTPSPFSYDSVIILQRKKFDVNYDNRGSPLRILVLQNDIDHKPSKTYNHFILKFFVLELIFMICYFLTESLLCLIFLLSILGYYYWIVLSRAFIFVQVPRPSWHQLSRYTPLQSARRPPATTWTLHTDTYRVQRTRRHPGSK